VIPNDSAKEGLSACEQLEEIGLRARASYGALRPADGALAPAMSDLSGPPSSAALFEPAGKGAPVLRRDADRQPQLPHENTAYLGRSLFTDYLFAVELGGTLLLVATIGAIAIAGRRGGPHA
jgi:hypothetical protein